MCHNLGRGSRPRALNGYERRCPRAGTPLNAARLAANLSVSSPKVSSYIDLLADLLLVRKLRPYSTNLAKRPVKPPKLYVRDCGLPHAVLGIDSFKLWRGTPSSERAARAS